MDKHSSHYDPLLAFEAPQAEFGKAGSTFKLKPVNHVLRRRSIVVVVLQALLTVILVSIGMYLYAVNRGARNPIFPQLTYSPAQTALEYQVKVAPHGFGPFLSPYQGRPSPKIDALWNGLYKDFEISKIPRSQAARLSVKSRPIPADPANYIVSLNIFHQLHCLDTIRKAYYNGYYRLNDTVNNFGERLDYCVEIVRRSLVCSADISPIIWRWVEEDQKSLPTSSIIHTCRNFDKIRGWAIEHALDMGTWDPAVYVGDGL